MGFKSLSVSSYLACMGQALEEEGEHFLGKGSALQTACKGADFMKSQFFKGFVVKPAGDSKSQFYYSVGLFLGCGIHLRLNEIAGFCSQ